MVNVTGDKNSGKSFIVALVQKFLGDGFANYGGTLASDVLNKPKSSQSCSAADSGRNPSLAGCRNKRFVAIADSDNNPFRSDIMKPLLEQKGEKVLAAANFAKESDDRDMHPTFLLWRVSNYELRLAAGDADPGIMGKVNELRVPNVFVGCDAMPELDQVRIEVGLEEAMLQGDFAPEVDFLTTWLYDSLSDDVCRGRHIRPKPSSVVEAEEEMLAGSLFERVRAFYVRNTTGVARDGSAATDVNRELNNAAGRFVDGNVQRAAGVLLKAGSKDSGRVKVHKFKYGDQVLHVLLKPEAELIPWRSLV